MTVPSPNPNSASPESKKRRESLRRGLAKSRITTGVTLLLATIMAVVGVYHAFRTEESLSAEKNAKNETETQLARALLNQARAERHARQPGSRTRALEAISQAAKLAPGTELRDEAAACLALDDLVDSQEPWELKGCIFSSSRLSPNFELYAAAFSNGVIIYDTATRIKKYHWRFNGYISSVRFSDDARYLAARTHDGAVAVFDLGTQEEIFREAPKVPKSVSYRQTIAFRPNSTQLAFSDPGSNLIHLIDLSQKIPRKEFKVSSPWCLAWHPDGSFVATISGDLEVVAFHADQGYRSDGPPAKGLEDDDYLSALAWHPDGLHIAAGTRHGWIVIGSTAVPKQRIVRAHSSLIMQLDFHPNGHHLASSSWDRRTAITDPYLCKVILRTFAGLALQYNQDGTRLARHQNESHLAFWDVIESETLQPIPAPFAIHKHGANVDFSPDRKWAAVTDHGGLMIWNLKERKIQSIAPGNFGGAGFTENSKSLVAVTSGNFSHYPIDDSGDLGKPTIIPKTENYSYRFGRVEHTSSGPLLAAKGDGVGAAVSLRGKPKLKHFVSGIQPWIDGSFHVSADNRWGLSTRRRAGGAIVTDLDMGTQITTLTPDSIAGASDPLGRYFATIGADTMSFWEMGTWEKTFELPRKEAAGSIAAISFSPDGKTVAASDFGHAIALYDPENLHQKSLTLNTPGPSGIVSLSFSRDSNSLAVISYAGHNEIWHLDVLRKKLSDLGLGLLAVETSSDPNLIPWFRTRTAAVLLATLGIIAALSAGVITARHQRRLIASYLQSEALADQQHFDLEKTKASLIQAQKMRSLGTLTAGVAHDFRNLLSVIRMANGFLKREPAVIENPDLAEETEAITQAVDKGDTVVRSMLGYSRSNEDESEATDLPTVIEEMVSMLGQRFLSGFRVTVEISPVNLKVSISKNRIEQILLNLLVNASEAMGERGELRISLTETTDSAPKHLALIPGESLRYAIVTIEDTGPGLDPDFLPHIFEPFFTTKHSGDNPGTGLGLFTIYTIAEKDGVGIDVHNLPKKGASFALWIPAQSMKT